MINIDTVRFYMMLETITNLSLNGIKPLSEAGDCSEDCVYYDDSEFISSRNGDVRMYNAVSVTFGTDPSQSENIMRWDEYVGGDNDYQVYVVVDGDDKYIRIFCQDASFIAVDGLLTEDI